MLAVAAAIVTAAPAPGAQALSTVVRDEGHGWFSTTNVSAFVDVAGAADTHHGPNYWEFTVTYRCNTGVWETLGANSIYTTDGNASAGDTSGTLDVWGWGRFCGDVVAQRYHFRADMTGTTSCGSSDSGPTVSAGPVGANYAKFRCNTGPGTALFDFYSAFGGGYHYNNYTGGSRLEYWNSVTITG
ncbi:MAG TPA: hypothetical protein VM938_03165 [Acidimicrobiales bacterium]|nr:hypothetical protein [Acidimicrobiales bacterium]